jgi:hypothetical protein
MEKKQRLEAFALSHYLPNSVRKAMKSSSHLETEELRGGGGSPIPPVDGESRNTS